MRTQSLAFATFGLFGPFALVLLAACGNNMTYVDSTAAYDAGVATPLQCVPTLDGQITAAELTPILNTPVKYLVSAAGTTPTVDVSGEVDSTGQLVWNWGTSLATDATIEIEATALTGKWYAASFPGGVFVTPFDAADTLEAVYHADSTAIWLHGLASTQESPAEGQTLYAYTQPVAITQFPLHVGASWTSTGTVMNGTLRGLPYASQDTYQVTDDATGELILPDLTFTQAHRVRTTVTLDPAAGESIVTQQVSYFFECFGEVARATSQPGETNQNFTTAAEVRRFGL
jgi:hypothetical protein